MKEMKSQLKWLATATCAAVMSAYAWADIVIDNTAALTTASASANKGNYDVVQFQLDDQRMAATDSTTGVSVTLDDTVWVTKIALLQRPDRSTIANNTRLRIRKVLTTNATTGFLATESDTIIAESEPLADGTGTDLTVAGAARKLRTFTFAAPVPLLKSALYSIRPILNGSVQEDALVLTVFTATGTTDNLNTKIHVDSHPAYSPCVRITAVERSKIADIGTSATWSGLWSEAPASTDTVGLNVTAANAALTMDTSATVAGLAIGSETAVGPLTFSGTGTLTSTTTSIATDTKVSDITASLGAVTLASGKTLTVGNATTLSGLAGEATSQVVYNLSASLADDATRRNLIQNFPGVVTFKATGANGATLAYDAASTVSLASCLAFDGGTHTFKYGRSTGQGQGLFATGRGDDLPTIDVKNGTTLDFYEKDLSGWNGTVQAKPAVIRVRNGGKLKFKDYGGSGFFRDRLVLDGGASVTMAGSNFILHGGTQDAAHAQIAMLDSETAVEATLAGQIGITNIDGGQAGQKASTIAVGNNATLKASAKFVGTADGGSLTKVGAGTLVLSSTETNTSNALTISAGKVLIENGSSWGTGAITVAESAALEVEVASADTTKIFVNTLSGAGTVKKLGAGTLSLTGTVSTPVEVAAGTLDIGTNRPAVNALASGAVLKVKATVAELSAQTITLTVGASLTDVTTSQLSVVDNAGSAVEGFSAAVADGTLTITLPSVLPTLTVNADGTQTWTNSASWPTSGAVKVDATAVTPDKTTTVALPASASFDELIVMGSSAKTTLTVGQDTTITTLSPSGYVAMSASDVNNRVRNAVSVAAGGIFEVTTDGTETLTKAISGAGTFAKGGTGVLTLGANVATTGGSIVQSGELKFSANGYINASSNTYADATGDVLVKSGAKLNLAGRGSTGGLLLREVTLEATATFKNETSSIGTNDRQLQKLTLLGDATVVADADFGLLAHNYGATTLTLNGHTLTKQGSGNFWLMNTTVNGASGKIVVEAGSVTNTGANKAVTFSTPITLESALTGTPFNLTGADVTASDNLTANGPVSFAKLITVSGKTIAGTGTVTVTDMTLGGPLNVTGNLVIDRTSATGTRSFNNAIKVASGGSLTTKGNITWNADSNEFLGSLTVASGTLSIKTPNQKLGGNITIARGATLTHTVKTAEDDKLDFTNPATIKVYGTLDMCKQRWTMHEDNKLYVYPGATVTGSGNETYGAFDAESGHANTISFCAADENSGSGAITFASNLRARANWTLDVAEGVTVNLTGVRAQTTSNSGTGAYCDNAQIAKTGAGKLIVGSNFRLNGACSGPIEVAAEKTLTLSGTVAHTAAFSGAGKILVTNDETSSGTPASSVTLNGTLGTVTGEGASSLATYSSPIEIGSGSKLIFNSATPTVLTNAAISGAGSLTIARSRTFTFGEGSNSSYSGATLVEQGATLVLNCENRVVDAYTQVGVLTAETADTAAVTVNGTLKGLKGAFYRQVKGSGLIQVPSAGALTIGRDSGGASGIVAGFTGTIEVESTGTLSLPSWSGTYVVANCDITNNGTIEGHTDYGTTTVTISNGKTLKGRGEILPSVTFVEGGLLDVSEGVLGLSEVSGTVTLAGYTGTVVKPVLNTASEVTFAETPDYTLPKSGESYWLVKDTAKALSAVATEDATWSALPWKSSDSLDVDPRIFALGLDLTANVSAAADMTYVALDMAATPCSTIDLTLSGNKLLVFYEGTETAAANFKSLTVSGLAAVEIAALNRVAGDVTVSGWLYPLDSGESVTPLTKSLTGEGTVAVLQNNAVTIASTLGSATNDEATFTGNLAVASGATLTLTSPIRQKVLGSIICLDTGAIVIGNGSQASGLVFTGRFGSGETSTFGGTLAISQKSYFTFASASAATVTGAVTGTGRLSVGDGSQASALTLTGQLGSVQSPRMDESADRCIYNGAIVVESGSTLTVAPTVQTLLAKSVTGSGKLVVGNGTTAQTVGLSAANTVSAVEVMPQATLSLAAGNASVLLLPETSGVTVAEGATLELSAGKLAATVSGAGKVSVPTGGAFTYLYPADATNVLGAAKVSIASRATFTLAAEREDVALGVNLLVVDGSLVGSTTEGVKTGPKVSVAADKSLGGIGSIEMPVKLAEGAILDGTYAKTGEVLKCVKTVSLSSVKVKADKLAVLLTCPAPTPVWQVENFALQAGAPEGAKVVLNENAFTKTTSVAISIPPTLPADPVKLPEAVAGNDQIVAAIKEKAEACLTFAPISEIASVTVKNSADKVVSADGAALFTGLEAAVEVVPGDKKTDGSYTATATITYDFGVSQITVKKAQLTGDTAPQLYVLACAKVSNGKTEAATAAGYADGTTVSLLLDGTEAAGAVALDTTTLSKQFGVTAGLGEQWFALPMEGLAPGTREFTVHAKNTPQAEVAP